MQMVRTNLTSEQRTLFLSLSFSLTHRYSQRLLLHQRAQLQPLLPRHQPRRHQPRLPREPRTTMHRRLRRSSTKTEQRSLASSGVCLLQPQCTMSFERRYRGHRVQLVQRHINHLHDPRNQDERKRRESESGLILLRVT